VKRLHHEEAIVFITMIACCAAVVYPKYKRRRVAQEVYVKRRTHEQTFAGERRYKSLGDPSAAAFVFFAAAARTRLVSADFW
jgi:ABC-type Fe3+ transport system permease subunit